MIKAIFSRNVLYHALNQLPTKLNYKLSVHPQGCKIDGVDVAGIGSAVGEFEISYSKLMRLWRVLAFSHEQPVTIGIDNDGWVYIKELIL